MTKSKKNKKKIGQEEIYKMVREYFLQLSEKERVAEAKYLMIKMADMTAQSCIKTVKLFEAAKLKYMYG